MRRNWNDKGSPESQRVGAMAIFVLLFAVVWIGGLTMGMAGGGCRQEDRPPERRLRLCNVSLGLYALVPFDDPRMSDVYQARGLIWVTLGHTQQAAEDFDRAIDLATDGTGWSEARQHRTGPTEDFWRSLENRIATEPEGSPARRLWNDAVARSDQ